MKTHLTEKQIEVLSAIKDEKQRMEQKARFKRENNYNLKQK